MKTLNATQATVLATSFSDLLNEVEELLGTGILTDECDLAERIRAGEFTPAQRIANTVLCCGVCGEPLADSQGERFCRTCGRPTPEHTHNG